MTACLDLCIQDGQCVLNYLHNIYIKKQTNGHFTVLFAFLLKPISARDDSEYCFAWVSHHKNQAFCCMKNII